MSDQATRDEVFESIKFIDNGNEILICYTYNFKTYIELIFIDKYII